MTIGAQEEMLHGSPESRYLRCTMAGTALAWDAPANPHPNFPTSPSIAEHFRLSSPWIDWHSHAMFQSKVPPHTLSSRLRFLPILHTSEDTHSTEPVCTHR